MKSHLLTSLSSVSDVLPKSKRLPLALTNVSAFDELFQLEIQNAERQLSVDDDSEVVDVETEDQLENVDVNSSEFKALSFEMQHEILMDIRYDFLDKRESQ